MRKLSKLLLKIFIILFILLNSNAHTSRELSYEELSAIETQGGSELTENVIKRLEHCEKMVQQQAHFKILDELQLLKEEVKELRRFIEEFRHHNKLIQEEFSKLLITAGLKPKPSHGNLQVEAMKYQEITHLIEKKDFVNAAANLEVFVKKFNKGQYIVNAYYWLGDIYTRLYQMNHHTNHLLNAKKSFAHILEHYGSHAKVCDALLKLGILAELERDNELAKQYYAQILSQFSNSSAARIAQQKLRQL